MSQEDKFKEAQRLYETANADQRYVLERLFPELKESERIRKALITAVSGTFKGNTLWHTDVTREEALAWLEKQAADKPYYTELLGYFEIGKRLNHSVEEIIDWLKSKI